MSYFTSELHHTDWILGDLTGNDSVHDNNFVGTWTYISDGYRDCLSFIMLKLHYQLQF